MHNGIRARYCPSFCLCWDSKGIVLCLCVCVCVGKKGTVLKDDRRVEQKSNHLIATFFISIFCFMAAEGRRATLSVIHGR